jgi:hypothetical protein
MCSPISSVGKPKTSSILASPSSSSEPSGFRREAHASCPVCEFLMQICPSPMRKKRPAPVSAQIGEGSERKIRNAVKARAKPKSGPLHFIISLPKDRVRIFAPLHGTPGGQDLVRQELWRVGLGSGVIDRRGGKLIERVAAFTAELELSWIGMAAPGTRFLQL